MTDQNMAGTGSDERQREAEALADQQRTSDELIRQQQETQDALTKEAMQAQHDRYQDWLASKSTAEQSTTETNQLMPASLTTTYDLPPAPREPLATTGTLEEIQAGKQALDAYKGAGFITGRDAIPANAQGNAADHALNQERAFRDRQQHLADKISDPKTSHEQRERLELQKATEYHNHHAESWANVAELQRGLGYPNESISEASQKSDHHKEQAALVANQLHQHDQKNGLVPKEVQLQLGGEKKEHNATHDQIEQRDPHLESQAATKIGEEAHTPLDSANEQSQSVGQKSSANPALERAKQRREAAALPHHGTEPSPLLQEQVAEANAREQQIEAQREQQKTEALGHKAELEQRAAYTR